MALRKGGNSDCAAHCCGRHPKDYKAQQVRVRRLMDKAAIKEQVDQTEGGQTMILNREQLDTLRGGTSFSADQDNSYTAETVVNLLDTIDARNALILRMKSLIAGLNYEFLDDGCVGRIEALALIDEAEKIEGTKEAK